MPNNVVDSPRDEKKWNKAERIAAKSGHEGDYAYIMGIYKKMKPDHEFKKAASWKRNVGVGALALGGGVWAGNSLRADARHLKKYRYGDLDKTFLGRIDTRHLTPTAQAELKKKGIKSPDHIDLAELDIDEKDLWKHTGKTKKASATERDWAKIAGDVLLYTSWDAKTTEFSFGEELEKIAQTKEIEKIARSLIYNLTRAAAEGGGKVNSRALRRELQVLANLEYRVAEGVKIGPKETKALQYLKDKGGWEALQGNKGVASHIPGHVTERIATRKAEQTSARTLVDTVNKLSRTGEGAIPKGVTEAQIRSAYTIVGEKAPKKIPIVERIAAGKRTTPGPLPKPEHAGVTGTATKGLPTRPEPTATTSVDKVVRRRQAVAKAPATDPNIQGLPTLSAAEVGAARSRLPAGTSALPYVKGEGTKQTRKLPQFLDDTGPAFSNLEGAAGKRVRSKPPEVVTKKRPPTAAEKEQRGLADVAEKQRVARNVANIPASIKGQRLQITGPVAGKPTPSPTPAPGQLSGDAAARVHAASASRVKPRPPKPESLSKLEQARTYVQRLEGLGDQVSPGALQTAKATESRLQAVYLKEQQRTKMRDAGRKGTAKFKADKKRAGEVTGQIKTTEGELQAAQRALENAAKGGDSKAVQAASREVESIRNSLSGLKGTAAGEAKRTSIVSPTGATGPAGTADKPGLLQRMFGKRKPKPEAPGGTPPGGELPVGTGGGGAPPPAPPAPRPDPGMGGLPVGMPPQAQPAAGAAAQPGFWGGLQSAWNTMNGTQRAWLGAGAGVTGVGGFMAGRGTAPQRGQRPGQGPPAMAQTPQNIIRRPQMPPPRYV